MQIGTGKQGVIFAEYDYNPQDPNGIAGYVQPACDNPQWIMWFTRRGDAILHRSRTITGAVLDEPMKIKGRPDKPLTKADKAEIERLKAPKMQIQPGMATFTIENFTTKL